MTISLIVNGKDISELVETVTWSGDTKQVARTLNFTMAQKNTDKYLPKVNINEGDQVLFSQYDKALFGGIVFDIDKSATSNVVTYLAFDLMFYINNSELSKVFDATPESIASQVCSELDVPFGGAAATGMEIYLPVLQKRQRTKKFPAFWNAHYFFFSSKVSSKLKPNSDTPVVVVILIGSCASPPPSQLK